MSDEVRRLDLGTLAARFLDAYQVRPFPFLRALLPGADCMVDHTERVVYARDPDTLGPESKAVEVRFRPATWNQYAVIPVPELTPEQRAQVQELLAKGWPW